jgi:hypothetical protein
MEQSKGKEKGKEPKLELTEQKGRLAGINKLLTARMKTRDKLTKTEYMQCKQGIKASNGFGLRLLERQQTAEALELLMETERVATLLLRVVEQNAAGGGSLGPVHKLRANIYNNIGYLYSQTGKSEKAYEFLLKTLDAESEGNHSSYRKGLTCLNISNILLSTRLPSCCRDAADQRSRQVHLPRHHRVHQRARARHRPRQSRGKLRHSLAVEAAENQGKTPLGSRHRRLLRRLPNPVSPFYFFISSSPDDALRHYQEAARVASELYGEGDKRTQDFVRKAEELAREVATKKGERPGPRPQEMVAPKASERITMESVIATTYGTFSGIRMKLIVVDYIKGKSLKIFGMKKDKTFAKSLCLPFAVFQIYLKRGIDNITAADIKNEDALRW